MSKDRLIPGHRALLAVIGGAMTISVTLGLGGPLLHHVPGADAWTWHPPEGVMTIEVYGYALNGLIGALMGWAIGAMNRITRRCKSASAKRRLTWVTAVSLALTLLMSITAERADEQPPKDKRARSVRVGDTIPDFCTKDAAGIEVTRDALLGKGPVVIYFYPKDETKGCTMQACAFRDSYTTFTDVGAEVVGVSSDSAEIHQAFADHHDLPFILLADPDNALRRAFGVPKSLGLLPGRVTYVTDSAGVVHHIFDSQLDVLAHVSEAVEVVKRLSIKADAAETP